MTIAVSNRVRIWTIQPAGLYEKLKAKRVLLTDGRRCHRDMSHAYPWMIDQMHRRLPPSRARFPWWGWYRWSGVRRAKPGLRAIAHLPTGQKGVRLELDLDDREVLLSDFSAWHFVLDDSFLSYDVPERERFDRELKRLGLRHGDPRPEPLNAMVLVSWERIFDLTGGAPDWWGKVSERSVQATFWELHLRDVTDATFFTAR